MRYIPSLFFTLLGGIACLFSVQIIVGQATRSQTPEKAVELSEGLRELGDKYDMYFTIEYGVKNGDWGSSIAGRQISSVIQTMDLQAALDQLQRSIPNLTYQYKQNNSKIIHIVDARLTKEKNYAIEKKIDQLDFDGFLFNLIKAISNKNVSISAMGSMSTSEALVADFATEVHVHEKDKKVRDIITGSIPKKGTGRVLWIAKTELGQDKTTFVQFRK